MLARDANSAIKYFIRAAVNRHTSPHTSLAHCTARRRPNRGETHTGKGNRAKTRQKPVQRTRNDSARQVERNPHRKRQGARGSYRRLHPPHSRVRARGQALNPTPTEANNRSCPTRRKDAPVKTVRTKSSGARGTWKPQTTRPTRSRARHAQPRALKAR